MHRRELVERDAVGEREVADRGGVEALDLECARLDRSDDHVRACEARLELGRLRGAHEHDVLRGAADELVHARVRDQPAAADHDQVVGGQGHLAHQVRRHEHGAAFGREPLQQVPDPVDALGVETVHRFVQGQRVRISEQRSCNPEPLAHSQRERPGPFLRNVLPDLVSNTVEVVKLTSLASVVALPEMLYSADMARSLTYNASPVVLAAAIYLLMLWPVVRLVSRMEHRVGS